MKQIAMVLFFIQLFCATAAGESDQLYCGIYSMYAVLQSYGRDVTLEELTNQKYLSSPFGTTLSDLERAAKDYDLHSLAMRNMTVGMLKDSTYPVILHTRLVRRGTPFQHWIVYLGTEDGRARIIDPPNAPELISFADLLSRWDGVGMVIADQGVSGSRIGRVRWLEMAICILASATALIVSVSVAKSRTSKGKAMWIVASAAVVAFVFHATSPEGFGRNADAVLNVVTIHHAKNLPELSFEQLQERLAHRSVVLIDARLASAFAVRCISGARSLPITAKASERARFYTSIEKDAEVVVYCQSNECGWSDEIASDMAFRGFANVSVYRGGYVEWDVRTKPTE